MAVLAVSICVYILNDLPPLNIIFGVVLDCLGVAPGRGQSLLEFLYGDLTRIIGIEKLESGLEVFSCYNFLMVHGSRQKFAEVDSAIAVKVCLLEYV